MDLKTMERYITTGWNKPFYHLNPEALTDYDFHVGNGNARIHKITADPYEIKKVVFNPPCTIILWTDGTKTIVRAQGDEPFDPEKGMTMAFMKKVRGNKGSYFDEIKKWVEPWEAKQSKPVYDDFKFDVELAKRQLEQATKQLSKIFNIPKSALEKVETGKPTLKDFERNMLRDCKDVEHKGEEEEVSEADE